MLEFPSQDDNTRPHFIGYPITTSPIVRNVYFQHFTKQPRLAQRSQGRARVDGLKWSLCCSFGLEFKY